MKLSTILKISYYFNSTLGGKTTLQCAVRSLGPTQIQWLKQLHDHQAPTDRNKTIVVFDFIFEVSAVWFFAVFWSFIG